MRRLALVSFLILCILAAQMPAACAEAAKPLYAVKVTEVSPSSGTLETPVGVTSSFRLKKVSGLGTPYSADATITVSVSEAVDYTWTPKEYYARLVSDDVGSSLGSAHDTQRMDETYYKISAVNISSEEWVTDFTFTITVPSIEIGDAEDVYVMLSGSSPVSARIRMYDGSTWKTIRTSKLEEGELVEFPVGKEYIQGGEVRVRVYTTDDSQYDVKMDYIAMKFRPATMIAKYTLPVGSKLVSVRKCCSGTTDVTNTVSDRTVSVDLSDYMDFENRYYSVEYAYTYTIALSEYSVAQKTLVSLSSADIPQTELEYLQSLRISMPYSHKIKVECEPSMSAIALKDFRVSDKGITIKDERDTQKFEMTDTGTIRLAYNLKSAYSFKTENLYNQTSLSITHPAWSSRYSIRRGYDVEIANVSIRHELIGDLNMTDIEIKPSIDYVKTLESRTMYLNFPALKSDVIIIIQESTAGLSANYTPAVQTTTPLPAGTAPVFRIDVGLRNPSERDMIYNISRKDLFSLLPDLQKSYPDLIKSAGDPIIADLKSGGETIVPLYFNSSAVLLSEDLVAQDPAVIGQPVQWRKVVRITNPGNMRYENITWNTSISAEAVDCMIDDKSEGTLAAGSFAYMEALLEPGQKIEHVLLYSTAPVRKTEAVTSSGFIEKAIEKKISLVNENGETVKVQAYTDITDVPNLDESLLEETLGAYTLTDKNGDGVNDMIKWKETLSPGETKSVVLNGKMMDLFSGIGAIGSLDFGGLAFGLGDSAGLALLGLAAIIVPIPVLVLAIRYVRHERRRRMLFYLTAIERALKGETLPPAAQKK
jgi:hypothetical protein